VEISTDLRSIQDDFRPFMTSDGDWCTSPYAGNVDEYYMHSFHDTTSVRMLLNGVFVLTIQRSDVV
jgi:hypothetical protein